MLRRRLVVVMGLGWGVAVGSGGVWACLNDRDTSSEAVQRLPLLVDVITGGFARNPPQYYSMREKRCAEELISDPGRLELYDDAAVACDRTGRFDEAIAWMEKKRQQMLEVPPEGARAREHWYRYHANIGTHQVHRWFHEGADRSRIQEVESAREHIARAIEIKPDAHFGRETSQLQVMDWILANPTMPRNGSLPTFLDTTWKAGTAEGAVEGLAGLVVLGNAWESVDVFHALALALEARGEPRMAFLARLRCEELIKQGRRSLVTGAPQGEDLVNRLPHPGSVGHNAALGLRQQYRSLRTAAERNHNQRTAEMIRLLEEGRHPDTDPTFWGQVATVVVLSEEHPPDRVLTAAPDPYDQYAAPVAFVVAHQSAVWRWVRTTLLLWILVAGVVGLWLHRRRARRVKSLVFTDAGT